jgi:methenyltetrahydromethanopterin cyclohydrolase
MNDPPADRVDASASGGLWGGDALRRALTDGVGLNERAWSIADAMVERAAELRIETVTLANGARIIDAGIGVPGGYAAGMALAELCMGGLGHTSFEELEVGGDAFPGVQVRTDDPVVSCMASQYAGWAIKVGSFFGMGSGPLRAHARVEHELFDKIGYSETATRGVLAIETRTRPTDAIAAWIAERARLAPGRLTIVVAPTASVAGGVQIVARILETGLHKMDALGFDMTRVVSGVGSAPIPPVATSDARAIGRTNDCILYGGQARYVVDAPDAELASLAPRIPSASSRDYGTPFYETFKRYDNDFYSIDPLLFSPAEVWLTNAKSGATFHAGRLNADVLKASLSG